MTRADLLALTPDGLAALANRGLVKRATKELDAGAAPDLAVDGDGAVRAAFGDGARSVLPAGAGLEAASCTCAATGVCRHLIGTVLAYQRQSGPGDGPGEDEAVDWSPGTFDDEALARVLGERALAGARRTLRTGYAARVHRPSAGDPVASVDLPTCSVRFLVPGELGYVHTDAADAVRGEVVVLAVWAFREADRAQPGEPDVRVDVGGGAPGSAAGSGVEPALGLVEQVLLDGAMHAGPVLGTALRGAAGDLAGRSLHWPAAALGDLARQLDAYRDRDAAYEPALMAALVAEVHARHRAGLHSGGSPRSQVLGTNESAETPLRRVRLTALGCRVGGTALSRTAEVYLAHAATGVVLVLRRSWEATEEAPLPGHELAGRRLGGAPLRALAAANVVSETAHRSASRVLRLGAARVAKTTVTPLGTAWNDLPGTLLVRDLKALDLAMAALPPRLVRPRIEAEFVRVVEIGAVRGVGYDPGAQRLEATVVDTAGTKATVSATHSPHAPGALDLLASLLDGAPRMISGTVRRAGGGLVIDPIAVHTGDTTHVLDLAPGDGAGTLETRATAPSDPLGRALDTALEACAEAAHRGLRHVPPGVRARVAAAADGLHTTGLRAAADLVRTFVTAFDTDDEARRCTAWVDAYLRLHTTAELR
ncbi:hypothetical protein [Spirillospora sp. CA-294931]|uniref:hypothetical protein n=1 Tax=Spirillospora sp. CA-294931 TaxID=3240042 RepID=UPI003D902867